MMIKLLKLNEGCSNYEEDGYLIGDILEVELIEPKYKGRVKDVNADYVFFMGEYEEVN